MGTVTAIAGIGIRRFVKAEVQDGLGIHGIRLPPEGGSYEATEPELEPRTRNPEPGTRNPEPEPRTRN